MFPEYVRDFVFRDSQVIFDTNTKNSQICNFERSQCCRLGTSHWQNTPVMQLSRKVVRVFGVQLKEISSVRLRRGVNQVDVGMLIIFNFSIDILIILSET